MTTHLRETLAFVLGVLAALVMLALSGLGLMLIHGGNL